MIFLNCGYYIVKPSSRPEWLELESKQVVTATDCICDLHPSLRGTFWLDCKKEQQDYLKLLKLSDKEFTELKETVARLYDENQLDVGCRFAGLSDALSMRKKYLYNLHGLTVISIGLENIYKDGFIEEKCDGLNVSLLTKEESGGKFIGYDILGWDYSSFHSYLCNSLHEDISEQYPLEINENGLIQNSYEQVKIFAEYLNTNDKGEPVNWLPFIVHEHSGGD